MNTLDEEATMTLSGQQLTMPDIVMVATYHWTTAATVSWLTERQDRGASLVELKPLTLSTADT